MSRRWMGLVVAGWLLGSAGCAHKREVYYPNDQGEVRVKAPFVDVRVPTRPDHDLDDIDD